MRVAVLIQGFAPRIGGAERQLLAVLPHVQRLGVDVAVLTRRYPSLSGYEEVRGIPVHRLAAPGTGARASLGYTLGAQAVLRRYKPDVLHPHELLSPTTTAMLAKSHLRVPALAKVLSGRELEVLVRRPLGRKRLALWLRQIDYFHVVSREIDQALAALGISAERRIPLPNGVDVEHFRQAPARQRREVRDGWALSPTAPVVVFTGRLSQEKGIAQLLKAWQEVVRRRPDAVLVVVGEGAEAERLRSCGGDSVRMVGGVQDVQPLLAAADVFVLPSLTEGMSNSLLEARASGLPAVATAVGGSAELAEQDHGIHLVPPGDARALAAGILEVLDRGAGPPSEPPAWLADRTVESTARQWVSAYQHVQAHPLRGQGP